MYEDWHAVKKLLGKAKQICDAGGDWEHKNKLKVSTELGIFKEHCRNRRPCSAHRGTILGTLSVGVGLLMLSSVCNGAHPEKW
jgi:hypothetical protein